MATDGGTLKATSINGVKTYSVVGQHRSLATWLDPKKRRALRKDKEYMQRVELIQDLRFETACTKIKATPDGEFLLASGIYPPQVKVYELRQLSLKFERHLTSEIVDFEILDEDYSKLAFLCADRSIYLHAKYGNHHCLRIPRMGRSLAYDAWSCDLLCAGSSPDLYRINLQQGRFLSPLSTQSPALNVVSRSKLHGLVACGGEDGAVECFDMRIKSSAGRINAVLPAGDSDQEVTAIEFDSDEGNLMAVGSSEGKVLIYDLRSSSPLQIKDHMYGSPIIDITWHQTLNEEKKLITTDKHVVRIWDPNTGEGMTSIEPTAGAINDVCVIRESGLILLALDSSMIPSYFIPTLGTAPKWCSYLENITEELEESAQTTMYEDYKFLTKEELEKLNRTDLIGTNLLRAYMHGYFIDYRLYRKLKELANPYSYEEYVEKRKKEKLEKLYSNQIAPRRKLPKVNKKLANELLEQEEAEKEKEEAEKKREEGGPEAVAVADKKSSKKKKGRSTELLKDPRFASMFEKEEFNIDEQSEEYKSLHPVTQKKPSSLVEEHFEPIMEAEEQFESDSDADSDDEGLDAHGRDKKKKPRLYEVKDDRHAEAFYHSRSLAKEDALTLEERIAALKNVDNSSRVAMGVKVGAGGSREISFFSKSKATYKEDEEDDDRHGKRRGIQSLGLKSDRSSESRGRGGGGRGRGGRGRGGSGGHGGGGGRGRGGGRRGGRGGGRGRSRGRH